MATIDVLLPVRNGIPFLQEALDSIRNQTFSDWRLLVLDHGSSDGTMDLAHQYAGKDKRILVFSLPKANGLAGLLNAGLEMCDCRIAMRQDADDVSFPNRMEVMTKFLAENSRFVVVGSDALMINESGKLIRRLYRPIGQQAVTAASFFYCPVVNSSAAIDLAAFRNIGAAYGKDFLKVLPVSESISVNQNAEDYILFGQLALLGLCTNIDIPLIKVRVHSHGVSVANTTEQLKLSFAISRFLSRSLGRLKNLKEFDPVPFSNHGGHFYSGRKSDSANEFREMSEILLQGLGDSPALRRELAFRWVLATKQPLKLLLRYGLFELHHRRNGAERALVMNAIRRTIRKKKYQYLDDL